MYAYVTLIFKGKAIQYFLVGDVRTVGLYM